MSRAALSPTMRQHLAAIHRREREIGRPVDVSGVPATTVVALRARGMIDTSEAGTYREERWRGYGQSKYVELAPPRPLVVALVTREGLAELGVAVAKENAAPLADLAAESLRRGGLVIERDPGRLARARRASESSRGTPSITFSFADRGHVATLVVWARPLPERSDPGDLWVIERGQTRSVAWSELDPRVARVARRVQGALRGE